MFCDEGGRAGIIDFWVTFSNVAIVVRKLIREAWTHYRWDGRPSAERKQA
jgi:hypothetical protein